MACLPRFACFELCLGLCSSASWLGGCTSQDNATISIVTGGETDTFTQTPVPTSLQVAAVQADGDGGQSTTILADATLPATSVDLGSFDESASAVLTVAGFDSNNEQVLAGQSLQLDFSELPGANVPIFVQRKGQFARLPNPLSDTRTSPTLAILQGEYLLVAGGDNAPDGGLAASLYDFLALSPTAGIPNTFIAPQSVAFDGAIGWLFDGDGGAYFDFSQGADGAITLPPGGGTFADIAGGQTLIDDNGVQYIVGATRTTGAPSQWVFEVNPNDSSNASYPYGNATWHALTTARLGASAAWVTGIGLVVAGGNATPADDAGDAAPPNDGAELLALGSSGSVGDGVSIGYPADPSVGAGAAMLNGQQVVIAGGILNGMDAGVRVIGTGQCNGSNGTCMPIPWPGLPTPITSVQAFALSSSSVLVVGSEPATASDGTANPNAGLTHVYEASMAAVTEIPTKVPHINARAIGSPIGSLVLFGGSDGGEIESFVP
jgi:hypothetical protein